MDLSLGFRFCSIDLQLRILNLFLNVYGEGKKYNTSLFPPAT